MKYFVDTNIFLRVLELEDQKIFNECSNLLKLINNSEINAYTSNFVLAELVWVLDSSYGESKSKITKSIDGILKLNGLKILDDVDTFKTLELFSKKSVKYIDALIASNSEIQSKKMTVISYDKDFDKLGVKRIEPSDILK